VIGLKRRQGRPVTEDPPALCRREMS
jgi:hypothetical protein